MHIIPGHLKSESFKKSISKCCRTFTALLCAAGLASSALLNVRAASDKELRLARQRAMTVDTNEIPNWPAGPVVDAESAILMDADTGAILYSKNIHQRQYPASTTKILTALIVSERCQLDEIVSFSHDAVFSTPPDSSHIAMDVGQELTLEQSLQAILICSANEVCYALAEHITHTTDWLVFAEIMNERAKELGCLDSHFVNPNGLPDEDHYTTAYDLAMIGRAFFANEMLCRITTTRRMEFPVTDKLPLGKLENNQMKIIPGGEYAYEYLVGCKTGFTDDARFCLVSCAEKNGLKLICVVLHDEQPNQYQDTIALFNYGFANFEKVNVSQVETRYNIDDAGLFYGGNDIFGTSRSLLSLNREDSIILPKTIPFESVESTISYETENENQAAVITYSYQGMNLGTAGVNFTAIEKDASIFDVPPEEEASNDSFVFINVRLILMILGILAFLILIRVGVWAFFRYYAVPGSDWDRIRRQYNINKGRRRRQRRNRRKRR